MAIVARVVPSARFKWAQGSPIGKLTPMISGHCRVRRLNRLRTSRVEVRATRRTEASRWQNSRAATPIATSPSRPKMVKYGITTAPPIIPARTITPVTYAATRTARGRSTMGRSSGGADCCPPLVTRSPVSDPAGLDRGDQDGAGPGLVQLVHHAVGGAARDHRAHGRPLAAVQRRDRRRLEAGGDLHRALQQSGGDVVVEH